ncbi:MAG: hypothetical protein LIO65_08225 [Odoribacter sp.]|nr:hypothetical protein [Odoribacter sp.]
MLGDLIQPTDNAPDEMWDIFYYRATNGNSYASPQHFYNIIVNANDFYDIS